MEDAGQKKRGILGWATLAMTPLGILAGPISIASMVSHLIEWHGPAGYIVNFWKEEIRPPFRASIEWLLSLVEPWLHIPKPPDALVDYIIVSLLLTSCYLRATYLVPKNDLRHTILNSLMYLMFWPLVAMGVIISICREGVKSWPRLSLTFAPIIGFLLLWAGNEVPKLLAFF
ncbi:hypothetical protein PQU94_17950 [Asticcacaulis sp. DXS10W]|uniref:Uncharacterized protein n=1 Tax=Asticcacaulis currens TaxID=2984210 RepID=A0ABT5IJX0_9CAUL|nr:hypothetical protein [Asticcacaulis currens]MDC7696163.1 hypothetical protein [Asticcacaulis currens]